MKSKISKERIEKNQSYMKLFTSICVIVLYFIWPYFVNSILSLLGIKEPLSVYLTLVADFILMIVIISIYFDGLRNDFKNLRELLAKAAITPTAAADPVTVRTRLRIENGEDVVNSVEVMVKNSDFIVQDGGIINANIDLEMINSSYKTSNINVIDEIEKTGEREEEDYSIIMYIVKKGDTLWKIAKMFGSTVDDIARTNGIEDENLILPGQKIFIPHYTKVPVSTNV